MSPLRLAIFGATGRFGQALSQLAHADQRFTLTALITSADAAALGQTFAHSGIVFSAELTQEIDVAIDVSLPAAQQSVLRELGVNKTPLVTGVTGYSEAQLVALNAYAKHAPLIHTHNFSRGVAVLKHLAAQAAQLLGAGYDVSILDVHHKHKLDAPSGTAKSIEQALLAATHPRAVAVQHAHLRTGSIVGEHTVQFSSGTEQLALKHTAQSRAMFAAGALDAAAWLAGRKPGQYAMDAVFGIAPLR
jgi:4-hydroxy-tetrahydrodipicolinate reductase